MLLLLLDPVDRLSQLSTLRCQRQYQQVKQLSQCVAWMHSAVSSKCVCALEWECVYVVVSLRLWKCCSKHPELCSNIRASDVTRQQPQEDLWDGRGSGWEPIGRRERVLWASHEAENRRGVHFFGSLHGDYKLSSYYSPPSELCNVVHTLRAQKIKCIHRMHMSTNTWIQTHLCLLFHLLCACL